VPAVTLLTVGVLAGLVAGLLRSGPPALVAPVCAVAALVCWRRLPAGAMLASGAAAGLWWGAAAEDERARDCRLAWRDGTRRTVVVEPADLGPDGAPITWTLRGNRRCRGAVRVVVPRGEALPVATLLLTGTWRREPERGAGRAGPPRPASAGRLVAGHWRPLARPLSARATLRLAAERRLRVLFGPERAPVVTALTVSPTAGLPREEREPFVRAGLAHLLSISGFHVGVLAGAALLLLRALRVAPDSARLLATLLVAGYVWLLGFPAPALRAAALVLAWALARWRQRPLEWRAAMAVTALAVALTEPFALLAPGPWLSFAGLYGCLVAARWCRRLREDHRPARRRTRWLHGLRDAMAVSAGASVATAPITLAAFGTMTPIGVVANLVAVPLASFAVPALALSLALATIPGLGPSLASLPAAAAGLALDALTWTTHLAGRIPIGHLTVVEGTTAALIAGAAAIVVLRPPPLRPARAVAARLGARAAIAGAMACAALVWQPVAGIPTGYRDGHLTLHFLAVGQGDAVLVRTPHGRWLLVDGGPRTPGHDAGRRVVVPLLRRAGVRALELVVASHGDADHLGGLPAVLEAVAVRRILEPGEALPRPLYREWLAAVAAEGAEWRAARAGDAYEVDGVRLRVWHPDSAFLARRLPPNENSVVVTLAYGAFRAILPGDAGRPMEAERVAGIGRATLLKVGHHGSRSATGPAWLAALRPRVCVVPVGPNRYGHPAPEVLGALARSACAVWRTDRDGSVTVATDGRTVRVRAAGRDTTFSIGAPE
jgi:competence protein ComEC